MSQPFQPPLPTFTGLDGLPLSGGYVYFGNAGQDPEQYPVVVYWDEAQTQVATQPLRTTAGYISHNGAPATVWVTGSCSVLVRDIANRQVFYVAEWSTPALGVEDAKNDAIADLQAQESASIAAIQVAEGEAEDDIAEVAARLTEQAEDVANAVGAAARPVYASTSAGLTVTASGQVFYVPHSTIANMLVQYRNVAGVATDTGRRFNQTTGEELGTAISLLDTETEGIAIDATSDDTSVQVKVIDLATPANNYQGNLLSFLVSTCFTAPKMVTLADGTLGWSDHNLFRNDAVLNTGDWGLVGVTASAPSGGLSTLTVTVSPGSAWQQANVVNRGYYHTATYICKAGSSPYVYIRFETTVGNKYAYFKLTDGTLGTADAGVTSHIYTTAEDGVTALAAGEYRIVATYQHPTAASTLKAHYGLADADASTAVTVGRTSLVRRSMLNWGIRPVTGYLVTTTAPRYGLPYDWSKGGRRLLIEELQGRFESKYGDDLTQADWTKTSCSAALTATGPHLEPCSTLTASGANATCLQSYTSVFTKTTFQAKVKRRTGTGSVYITVDGGSNWTDVTALINSTGYSTVYVHGTSSSVNMGFKIATNGDAIDVSLAVTMGASGNPLGSPMPTYDPGVGGYYQRNVDTFRIATTKFHLGSAFSVFADFETSADTGSTSEYVGVLGASDFHFIKRADQNYLYRHSFVSSVTYVNYANDNLTSALRVEGAMRVAANDLAISINGTGELYDPGPAVGTLTNIAAGGGPGQCFLRRLLLVPRALADDSLRLWRYSGDTADSRYLADLKVAKFKEIANTHLCREPGITVLRDEDDYSLLFVTNMQRYITANPDSGEAPARLMGSIFRFDKETEELTNTTGLVTLQQQANWTSGLGHLQGPLPFKFTYGANKGRLGMFFTQLDTVNGRLSPDWRRIYYCYSDDNGTTWSATTMVYDPGAGFAAITVGSSNVAQITSGTYAGRILVPFYTNRSGGVDKAGILYSDNGGASWTAVLTTLAGSEGTLHALPGQSTLVLTLRQESSPWRTYATSTDGGATWSAASNMTLTEGVNVAMALTQNDPDGGNGLYGEQLLIGVRRTSPWLIRSKLAIEAVTGSGLTVSGSQFCPLGVMRAEGYVSAQRLSGGYLAIGYESSPTGVTNSDCDVRLMVVRWPE